MFQLIPEIIKNSNFKNQIKMNSFNQLTAVGAVIGVHPIILAPRNGFSSNDCFLRDIKPGISEKLQMIYKDMIKLKLYFI